MKTKKSQRKKLSHLKCHNNIIKNKNSFKAPDQCFASDERIFLWHKQQKTYYAVPCSFHRWWEDLARLDCRCGTSPSSIAQILWPEWHLQWPLQARLPSSLSAWLLWGCLCLDRWSQTCQSPNGAEIINIFGNTSTYSIFELQWNFFVYLTNIFICWTNGYGASSRHRIYLIEWKEFYIRKKSFVCHHVVVYMYISSFFFR